MELFLQLSFLLLSSLCLSSAADEDPPYIAEVSKDQMIDIDYRDSNVFHKFNMTCRGGGGGGGTLSYEWHQNGYVVKDDDDRIVQLRNDGSSMLRFLILKKRDAGDYRCFVKSSGGKSNGVAFSRIIRLKLSYVEAFKRTTAESVSINKGGSRELVRPAINPSSNEVYSWATKDQLSGSISIPLSNEVTQRPNGNLLIVVMTDKLLTYQGIFCRAESRGLKYNAFSHRFNLVQSGGATFDSAAILYDRLSSKYVGVEGGTLQLWCTAKGKPAPAITWWKDGKELTESDIKNNPKYSFKFAKHVLYMSEITKDMAGKYACNASNRANNQINRDSSTTSVTFENAPNKWYKKPSEEPMSVTVYGAKDLECQTNGNPSPTYEWYKNGEKVPGTTSSTSGTRFEQLGGTLKMKNLLLTDTGVYQCKAKNKHGEILAATYVKVVAYPPTFEGVQFGPFALFRGATSTLKCEPDAAPPPTKNEKIWLYNGQDISKADSILHNKDDDGNLRLVAVTDVYAGQYTCKARNSESQPGVYAEATAPAVVLDPTKIFIAPKSQDVVKGKRLEVVCIAQSDKSLEHRIRWYKGGILLQYDSRIRWVRGRNRLIIDPVDLSDGGTYKCEAYTPLPSQSIDTKEATIRVLAPPEPPSNVQLTGDCGTRSARLSWKPNSNNNAPILRYHIEYGSKYEPGKFFLLQKVEGGGSTAADMNGLSYYAKLMFRVRAINKIGASEPSEATDPDDCVTPQGPPTKFPDNLRGRPTTANKLDIVWDPFTKLDENAPGCKYILNYRRPGDSWIPATITDCSVGEFPVPDPGYYQLWEFKIQARNDQGFGPESDVKSSRSGQDAPSGRPTGIIVDQRKPRSVRLRWNVVTVSPGNVDGYRVNLESETLNTDEELEGSKLPKDEDAGRFRRAVNASETRDLKDPPATLAELGPYRKYTLTMRAFNSGGEGPASDAVSFETPEDVPGPPSHVIAYPFAHFIMVRWDIPEDVNGRLVGYSLSISPQQEKEQKDKYDVAVNRYEHVFQHLKEKSYYNISVWARTARGDGTRVWTDLNTIYPDRPYQPDPPFVEAISTDSVNVTFMVGAGGGFPVRYVIGYRRKPSAGNEPEDMEFLPTKQEYLKKSWVVIEDLQDRVYQFVSIGYNDLGASRQSEITEARPLSEPRVAARAAVWYSETWFIVLIVIVLLLVVALLLVYFGTRKGGARYPVGKREKDRAGILEDAPEDDGGFNNYPLKPPRTPQGSPPPYESEGSLNRSDRDSLDDYGEDEKFNEDGSFIGEYSEDKKKPQDVPDERDDSAFATFV